MALLLLGDGQAGLLDFLLLHQLGVLLLGVFGTNLLTSLDR